MQDECLKLLVDNQQALTAITEFTAEMDLQAYRSDAKCRAAVERKFEIIGEASTRIRDRFPDTFDHLSSGSQIIRFRNHLIHGYDNVDDAIVWDVVTQNLTLLLDVAIGFDPTFQQFAHFTESLTDQFWAQHYPGGDLEDFGVDYTELREQTGRLVELVLKDAQDQ